MDRKKDNTAYAFGKISSACQELSVGEGDIKDRLLSASDKLWAVSAEMLPLKIREDFIWIEKKLTKYPAFKDEGAVFATIKRSRKKTLVEIAKRIVLIESELRAHLDGVQNSCPGSWSPPNIVLNNTDE